MTRLWSFLTSVPLLMVLLWLGLAAFSVTLVILIWTRWGQTRPLRKCFLLSLLAHLLLAVYATTVQLVAGVPAMPEPAPTMHVVLLDWPVGPGSGPNTPGEEAPSPAAAPAVPPASSGPPQPNIPATMAQPTGATPPRTSPPPMPEPDAIPLTPVVSPDPAPPQAAVAEENPPTVANENPPAVIREGPSPNEGPGHAVPEIYRLRMSGDHVQAAVGGGGSPETEAAVKAALSWLTSNQNPDGRWEAKRHEAGRDTMPDRQSRPNTGLEADAGMTGLALLSLLGSGHTHHCGSYQETVRRGLEFLLAIQAPSGSLAGPADCFAAMYCHAMATLALSEAYGMTGDPRLEGPVRRAIGYTVAAQDPLSGGWRYWPRYPGDTSQLGWQLMALRSGELAGIPIPEPTRANAVRYLQSVAAGQQGGLASYRPRERVTRTMTAEALFCWQLLGMARQHPAGSEAGDFLLGDLPGQGQTNFYYWYYGTLATFHLQGRHWERWNDALRTHLLATQRRTEPLAGSWDPDPVWGGYGGRIYSTSLATLSLEVYYRYLPLGKAGIRDWGLGPLAASRRLGIALPLTRRTLGVQWR